MTDVAEPVDLETYDPMEPAMQQCPFPGYAALRAEAPVYHHPGTGMYFVSRLDTINQVLRDPETFSSQAANVGTVDRDPAVMEKIRRIGAEGWPRAETMLSIDPPLHTRYRKQVSLAFSPRRIAAQEDAVRRIVDELIDELPTDGDVDFKEAFAVPFPVRVIAHVLNMPAGHEADIKRWSDNAVAALGAHLTPEARCEAARGVVECQQFWHDLVEQRRADPQDDILTDLVQTTFDDPDGGPRPLRFPEIFSIVQQLMVAGNETTTKLFTETTRLLIENPEWFQRMKDDPSVVPAVVEEGLRMSSPNQGLFRTVTADTELEGVPLPAGSRLWIIFGSANRDERAFPGPDRFDPGRSNLKDHIAFGKGVHFCIGAPLSRLEGRVGYEHLARRIEHWEFHPDEDFRYEPSFILRGLESLRLRIRRSS